MPLYPLCEGDGGWRAASPGKLSFAHGSLPGLYRSTASHPAPNVNLPVSPSALRFTAQEPKRCGCGSAASAARTFTTRPRRPGYRVGRGVRVRACIAAIAAIAATASSSLARCSLLLLTAAHHIHSTQTVLLAQLPAPGSQHPAPPPLAVVPIPRPPACHQPHAA
jgi:hypothetical protein